MDLEFKMKNRFQLTVFFFLVCADALGMENGAIPDGNRLAPSEWDPKHAANQQEVDISSYCCFANVVFAKRFNA